MVPHSHVELGRHAVLVVWLSVVDQCLPYGLRDSSVLSGGQCVLLEDIRQEVVGLVVTRATAARTDWTEGSTDPVNGAPRLVQGRSKPVFREQIPLDFGEVSLGGSFQKAHG